MDTHISDPDEEDTEQIGDVVYKMNQWISANLKYGLDVQLGRK